MANTFKLKSKTNVGVTTVGIYTVPSSTTTVVIGITLANTSGSGINVGVGVSRAAEGAVGLGTGHDDISLLKNTPIPQGSSLEVMQGNKIVMEASDIFKVESDVNNSLDVALTIMEIS
tara:strand:+ start:846 stop:1199 length:354 start_codon:yes stop_codon:yes gene_type:complete